MVLVLRLLALLALVPAVDAAAGQGGSADASAWEIGPMVRSRNHSVGMPLQPTPDRAGWHFDFPYPSAAAGHVHALTFRHGSLAGARRLVVRYRIDAAPGTRFAAQESPELPATLSLFFQRAGDSWSGRGRFETYRWYAPLALVRDLSPGVHEVSVPLNEAWISVQGRTAAALPAEFQAAIEQTDRVGFVLGSRLARGHGVYATGPARFTLLSFQVL